jgi:DNA-directed RNA polymerase specialized sigma24 family protein
VAVDDLEFREFFASQHARLCWLGYLLSGDRAEAEELAQDALVRTYHRWARVCRPNDPPAYARRVLVNRHRSRLRRVLLDARYLRRSHDQQAYLPDFGEDAMVVWAAVGRARSAHRSPREDPDWRLRRRLLAG